MVRGVMFQFFEWYCVSDGSLWRELAAKATELKNLGTTAVWFPPPYKAFGGDKDTGYAVYDLYDLGEFEQKGTVRTKYGTREEFLAAVRAVQTAGMDAYIDTVFNQRMGGDETEEIEVVKVANDNRNAEISQPYKIKAYSKYLFAARNGKYSTLQLSAKHFTSFGYDASVENDAGNIYRVASKHFADHVSGEFGNFDYLMGADVDQRDEEVRADLFQWGEWMIDSFGAAGFRLDAVKHMPAEFLKDWFLHLKTKYPKRDLFAVGEYWSASLGDLQNYLHLTDGVMRLFDVPLHFHFCQASQQGRDYDIRTIFDGTLVRDNPLMAVTFVENHDSQPGQALESSVGDWFKPLAYALILLRDHGYPCVFYGDYFGGSGDADGNFKLTSHRKLIDDFLAVRKRATYGQISDYFDHPQCIAWTWTGDADHVEPSAVVLSTGEAGTKRMKMVKPGETYRDITGHWPEPVTTDQNSEAEFRCQAGSVSVWLRT